MNPKQPKKIPRVQDVIREKIAEEAVILSVHAIERMHERRILQDEVLQVLRTGKREAERDRCDPIHGWSYSFRSRVHSTERNLRVVVKVSETHALVVTAVDLDPNGE